MEATGIFVPRVAGQTSALVRRGQNWDVNAVQGPHSTVLPINRPRSSSLGTQILSFLDTRWST